MKKLLITLTFILAGTSAFALPVKVGDDTIDVYASVRAFTVFNHNDKGDIESRDRSQFTMGLQSNSRVGMRWTQGNFFVNGEMGFGGDAATSNPTLRLLYGDYKFAGGKSGRIRIGQMSTIVNTHSYYDRKLNQDNGLQGYGTIGEARRFGINYEIGSFSISAVSMRQDSANVTGLFTSGMGFSGVEFSEIMPRIEATYTIIPNLKVAGTYVSSSVVANNSISGETDKRYSVNAGHITVIANPQITKSTKITASGFYSVNGGLYNEISIGGGFNNYESVNRNIWAAPVLKEAGKGDMYNTTVLGGAVAVVYKAFEAGFGIQNADSDAWEDCQTGMGVYANYKFRVSNFRITPEVGYMHSGDRGRSAITDGSGKVTVPQDTKGFQAGIQFRFDI